MSGKKIKFVWVDDECVGVISPNDAGGFDTYSDIDDDEYVESDGTFPTEEEAEAHLFGNFHGKP